MYYYRCIDFLEWYLFYESSCSKLCVSIIKPITKRILNQYVIKKFDKKEELTDIEYETYFNNVTLFNKNAFIGKMLTDSYTINIFKKNKLLIYDCYHEGIVLIKDIIFEIYNFYNNSNINNYACYKKICNGRNIYIILFKNQS